MNDILDRGFEWSDLFEQNNEHRILFPNIIYLTSGFLTDFNVKANMYITWIFQTGIYGIILLYLKNHYINKNTFVLFGTLLGFVLFSFVQYENMLWGFQIGFVMVAFFAVASFYFLDKYIIRENNINLFLSIISAVTASFSSLQGLFIWIVIIPLLLFLNNRKALLFFTISMLLCALLYFSEYQMTIKHTNLYTSPIIDKIRALFITKGGPFILGHTPNIYFALFFGIFISLLQTWVLIKLKKNNLWKQYLFPIWLILYETLFCLSIAFGRASMALASRYTTFVIMGIVGFLLIIFLERKFYVLKYNIYSHLLAIVIFILITQNLIIPNLKYYHNNQYRKFANEHFIDYRNFDEQTLNAISNADITGIAVCKPIHCLEILEKRKWSVFAK